MLVHRIGALVALAVVVRVCIAPRAVVASTRGAGEEASPAEEDAKKRHVRCRNPGSAECVDACVAINAYCGHRAEHPYSPSSGEGKLYSCESEAGQWQCRYRFTNGDTCTLRMPRAAWTCLYPTPMETPE